MAYLSEFLQSCSLLFNFILVSMLSIKKVLATESSQSHHIHSHKSTWWQLSSVTTYTTSHMTKSNCSGSHHQFIKTPN